MANEVEVIDSVYVLFNQTGEQIAALELAGVQDGTLISISPKSRVHTETEMRDIIHGAISPITT